MTRQVLALRKKTQKKCEAIKNRKNHKGLIREIKIKRFLRLNNPHKAPFRIEIKRSITTRNPMVRVKMGMTTSLHQQSDRVD